MMKRTTFSVVFFCKKTKLTKKGTATIYARITASGQISEIHTQCQAVPEHRNQRLERGLHAVTARYSPENTTTEQIENLKGQQETLPVDVRYYSFAGAVEGRADGL